MPGSTPGAANHPYEEALMKLRILIEQQARDDSPYRASGEEVDVPAAEAEQLLGRGDAEAIGKTPAKRADKRKES